MCGASEGLWVPENGAKSSGQVQAMEDTSESLDTKVNTNYFLCRP